MHAAKNILWTYQLSILNKSLPISLVLLPLLQRLDRQYLSSSRDQIATNSRFGIQNWLLSDSLNSSTVASYISISKSGNFFQIFVAFSEYLHFICNLFVQKEIEIFERMEFILWWKTLWYSLLTIVECSTNFLERKNAPARQWQSVINPAGQQLRCDAQRADIWNFVQENWLSIPQLWAMNIKVFFITK